MNLTPPLAGKNSCGVERNGRFHSNMEEEYKNEKLVSQTVLEKPAKEGNSPVGESLFHTS